MVYITVGSAAYPILEFLEEWGTENFEVRAFDPVAAVNFLFVCYFSSLKFYFIFRKFLLRLFHKLQKFLLMVAGLVFIEILICW